jgi:formylglycine-generating enzyme required for sulfatase activity
MKESAGKTSGFQNHMIDGGNEMPVPELVELNGGEFIMGTSKDEGGRKEDEGPQHKVVLDGFSIGKYEISQNEFAALMGFNPSPVPVSSLPQNYVSWFDAVNYCNALSKLEGLTPVYTVEGNDVQWQDKSAKGYRLPTEAEWEYACRAGTTTSLYINVSYRNLFYYANYDTEVELWKGYKPSPGCLMVSGSYPPNPWGLYDMMGNVAEWCWDMPGDYPPDEQNNPTGPDPGAAIYRRIVRGGNYQTPASSGMRSGCRENDVPHMRYRTNGFRVVRKS